VAFKVYTTVVDDKETKWLLLQDLSMQKELERTKQKQQLLKLVTANVSHELIAPLKSIISFV
jgi:signal transduction histidine kinase